MVLSAPNLLLEPSHRVTAPWGLIFDVTSSALGVSNFTPFRMQNPSECRLVGAFRESQLDWCIYGQAHGPRGSVTGSTPWNSSVGTGGGGGGKWLASRC